MRALYKEDGYLPDVVDRAEISKWMIIKKGEKCDCKVYGSWDQWKEGR